MIKVVSSFKSKEFLTILYKFFALGFDSNKKKKKNLFLKTKKKNGGQKRKKKFFSSVSSFLLVPRPQSKKKFTKINAINQRKKLQFDFCFFFKKKEKTLKKEDKNKKILYTPPDNL